MMAEKHEPKLLNFRVKNESESEENTPKDSADGPYNQSPSVELDEEGKEKKTGNKFFNAIKEFFNSPNLKVAFGKTLNEVPSKKINKMNTDVVHAYEAPDDALSFIHERKLKRMHNQIDITPVAGIVNWKGRNDDCYGIVTSLYEREKGNGRTVGDPVADCLAIVARSNNCILALADGVNWGERSMLAARSAVYGAITYLTREGTLDAAVTTKDVFRCILRAFETAQNSIMEEDATLTTLCVGVVFDLPEKDKWGLCVVNVGDSLAFVYNNEGGVREVTIGSHSLDETRDMRLSGGALGPADGYNPDLGNLTLSYTQLENDDIVYLTSDGISDNFDPVVGRFRMFRKFSKQSPIIQRKSVEPPARQRSGSDQSSREMALSQEKDENLLQLSTLTARERHQGMLYKMRWVIENVEGPTGTEISAIGVCAKFINFALFNTNDRRCFLETVSISDEELQHLSGKERKERTIYIKSMLSTKPGKLDHSSIVAFKVGHHAHRPFRRVTTSSESYYEVQQEDLDGFASPAEIVDETDSADTSAEPVQVNSTCLNQNKSFTMLNNLLQETTL